METLARTVEMAHRAGVIHRDLKPANILLAKLSQNSMGSTPATPTDYRILTPDYSPKITDFGLAKRVDAGTTQSHSGAIMGTPSYMAPEKLGG